MRQLSWARNIATLRWSLLAAVGIINVACREEHVGDSGEHAPEAGAGAGTGGDRQTGQAADAGEAGGAGAGGAGATDAGSGQGGTSHVCTSPELDQVSGLVSCAEGYEHRPSAVACDLTPAGGAAGEPLAMGGVGGVGEGGGDAGRLPVVHGEVSCWHKPEACEAFNLGYCEENNGGGGNPAACHSGCVTDQDCGTGYICICDGLSPTGGKCLRSDCATDSDCGPGYLCASFSVPCGYGGFACQQATDECTGDDECGFDYCSWNTEHRYCEGAACGRPFLVQASARVAPPAPSSAWLGAPLVTPHLAELSAADRHALAQDWTRMGQLEHASIAAFARFALQLLALGAPPELVEDCTRAMADETAHARLCFELASAYAGSSIGPGALDIDGSLTPTSLTDIVDLVLVEGCFGETGAALEALEAADAAIDPVIREVYARIARDEQRHAELAFRFVHWALERDREAVERCIEAACQAPEWRRHAARDVTVPCLQALLGDAAPRAPRTRTREAGAGAAPVTDRG